MRTWRGCAVLLAASAALLLAGCPTSTFVSPNLTATLAYLAAHTDELNSDNTAITGTPVTAEVLAGCWGRAMTDTETTDTGVTVTVTTLDAYQFDAATGSVTESIYIREAGGDYAVALIGTGTYTVTNAEIHITIDGWLGNDPTTGEIDVDAGEGEDYTLTGTVSGDQLMLAVPGETDGRVAVYRRFECQD